MHEYLSVMKKYAVFEGRARRKEFWMFALVNFIISAFLGIVSSVLLVATQIKFLDFVPLLYFLIIFIPGIAVTVRRLHDTDRSGWWALLVWGPLGLLFVTIALWGVTAFMIMDSSTPFPSALNMITPLLVMVLIHLIFIGSIVLLVFMCLDSTPGPNRFGPNPKDIGGGETPVPQGNVPEDTLGQQQ